MDTALAVELLDPAADIAYRHQREREAYERGRADGHREGYVQAVTDWKVTMGADIGGVSYAELERRRWTVRGEQRTRETFGNVHAQDYIPARSRRREVA